MDSYHRANELFVDEEYDAAAALYSKAVAEMPDFASALSCRSAAYIKLRKYTQALEDCNNVIKLDASLEPAYLRKGLACFELGEYETAKRAFETGKRLRSEAGKDVTVYARNIRKCDTELSHPNGVFQAAPVSAAAPAAAPIAPVPAPAPSSAAPSSSTTTMTTPIPHAIKYQYYQSAEAVNISVLAKNVTPDEAEISIQPGHLRVRCRGETVIDKQLYADVDVGASTYDIRKTKIEIVLRKVRRVRRARGPPRPVVHAPSPLSPAPYAAHRSKRKSGRRSRATALRAPPRRHQQQQQLLPPPRRRRQRTNRRCRSRTPRSATGTPSNRCVPV